MKIKELFRLSNWFKYRFYITVYIILIVVAIAGTTLAGGIIYGAIQLGNYSSEKERISTSYLKKCINSGNDYHTCQYYLLNNYDINNLPTN